MLQILNKEFQQLKSRGAYAKVCCCAAFFFFNALILRAQTAPLTSFPPSSKADYVQGLFLWKSKKGNEGDVRGCGGMREGDGVCRRPATHSTHPLQRLALEDRPWRSAMSTAHSCCALPKSTLMRASLMCRALITTSAPAACSFSLAGNFDSWVWRCCVYD